MLAICQSCKCSLVGCQLWQFIDTNDYFGCPSYSPFEVPEIPDPADEPGSPQGLGLDAEPEQDAVKFVPIDILDLPF